jgi:arylsulfatase A-like enzyme
MKPCTGVLGSQVAIRKGDWKLVKGVGVQKIERRVKTNMEGAELYNVGKDIRKKMNLADQEPAKVKELAADWDRWNRENVAAKWIPARSARNRANQPD